MFKKNFLSTTVILLSLVGAGLGVSAFNVVAGTVAHVASGYVILHTGPATTYQVIETVPIGAKVQINSCLPNKSWCLLQYNGRIGWASARYFNVNNVPIISSGHMHMKLNPMVKVKKGKVKQVVPDFKIITAPQKIQKQMQKQYRIDVILDHTGVKKRDERTILNPSPNAHGISVEHVAAYNPLFPNSVHFKNFERNETRYRVVTYPTP
ncbi:SH3 domain-containing protein [Bartonella sp. B35(2025)]